MLDVYKAFDWTCDGCGKKTETAIRQGMPVPNPVPYPTGWCIVELKNNYRTSWRQESHFCSPECFATNTNKVFI